MRKTRKMNPYKSFIILATLALTSCANESTSDLIDIPLVENVTYTNSIKEIIDSNCLGCHGNPTTNSAPMSLNTYSSVKEFVQNDKIIERISKEQGQPGMMPLGGNRLPQPFIDLIIKWKQQGLQE